MRTSPEVTSIAAVMPLCRGSSGPPRAFGGSPRGGSRSPKWPHPALLRDLWGEAPGLLATLAPPHRQIAVLQYLEGVTLREIHLWMETWQPVTRSEFDRLVRLTHAMLRAIGRGEDPRVRWRHRYDPKKNRWLTTPPPLFGAHTW